MVVSLSCNILPLLTHIAGIKKADIDYMQQLAALTNIMPLLAQSDTLTGQELDDRKREILHEMRLNNIHSVLLPNTHGGTIKMQQPYAISTLSAQDDNVMDASLLMSPDYVCPLIHSDLEALTTHIFDPETVAFLRHTAATKIWQWQHLGRSLTATLDSAPTSFSDDAPSMNTFTLARLRDHIDHDNHLVQLQLSPWASRLRHRVQTERMQFEGILKSQRAVWLTERLSECARDGSLLPRANFNLDSIDNHSLIHDDYPSPPIRNLRSSKTASSYTNDHIDPLGILAWDAGLRFRTRLMMRLLTGVSLVASIVFLVVDCEVGKEMTREVRVWKDWCWNQVCGWVGAEI